MSQLSSLSFRPYYGSLSFSVNRTPSFCRFNLPFRCPTTRAMASWSQIVGYPRLGPERAQVCFGIILGVDIDLVTFTFFSYESSVILMENFSKENESKCKAHKMSYRTIEATCLAVNMLLTSIGNCCTYSIVIVVGMVIGISVGTQRRATHSYWCQHQAKQHGKYQGCVPRIIDSSSTCRHRAARYSAII